MKAVVVGSGAREHALCLALARTADVVALPGNPGINGRSPEGFSIESLVASPLEVDGDLYVIGPEAPLVAGLADELRAKGKLVFGPGADGARLEGSKTFMKRLARTAGAPTADYASFTDLSAALDHLAAMPGPFVIKTDGLTAGKGVLVTSDLAEAQDDVRRKLSGESFGDAGRSVVIEEGLSGPELSLLVVCDGHRAVPLPAAQDFKRLSDGDEGPNTGGMGAYSPVPFVDASILGDVMDRIVEPCLRALRAIEVDYRGMLYAGLMLTKSGPKLIEFNVRLGDPEAQVVLDRLDGDVFGLFAAAASGALGSDPEVSADASVCVVAAAAGYPADPRPGDAIHGLERAGTVPGVTVLHAGTALDSAGHLRVAGGRVLSIRGRATTLSEARERAYLGLEEVSFVGMQARRDIALEAARHEREGVGS